MIIMKVPRYVLNTPFPEVVISLDHPLVTREPLYLDATNPYYDLEDFNYCFWPLGLSLVLLYTINEYGGRMFLLIEHFETFGVSEARTIIENMMLKGVL